ncbi:MAG: YIP1 family protein [Myxococcales bacterium]|nr:YIP1 family protein [Myxococcales bacterium]
MYCQACGAYNPEGTSACLNCGVLLAAAVDPGGAKCRKHSETPAVGTCSRCGSFGCGVCLSQRGAAWWCDDCVERAGTLPWDERAALGTWRAWWRTCVLLISSPVQTLEAARPEGGLGGSVLFSVLATIAGYATTLGMMALVMVPSALMGAQRSSGDGKAFAVIMPLVVVVYAVMIFGFQLASVLVLAGLDHLMLMLFGAQPRGYEVSVRANALAMAPALIGLVPICGIYVWPLWALVLRIIALAYLHKTTGGKAAAAVLVPAAVLCGLCGGAYALLFAAGMSQSFR